MARQMALPFVNKKISQQIRVEGCKKKNANPVQVILLKKEADAIITCRQPST